MLRPRIDQRHVVAACGEIRADIATDRAGADEGDAFAHAIMSLLAVSLLRLFGRE